jgi:hypothetical protein
MPLLVDSNDTVVLLSDSPHGDLLSANPQVEMSAREVPSAHLQ